MDDTSINLAIILEQAPKWTFAGDFTLLQWMKQISQDLECRATKTTEGLAKLNHNIKSTNIALDNVANRLTALQFGNQFVESRVQDDDETLLNANETNKDYQYQSEQATPREVLTTFLDNNLKVLRNCHERYSIDLEDSDDEENSTEKTCIYQPINPYNERPLPYIFGSKDWHSKWHVGLYENQQENNYSGDELSEVFSESSSTSHLDDNESFESNTEWASSNSIDNLNANIEVKNASSLQGFQPLSSATTPLPVNVIQSKATLSESSSISTTTSSSLAKKSLQAPKLNENLTQRSESANSIDSKNSTSKAAMHNRENALQYKVLPQPFVDLFAEPPEDLETRRSSSVSSASNIIHTPDNNRKNGKENPTIFRSQPPPFVDLFAEPPEDVIMPTTTSALPNPSIKRRTVNLFDEDKDNMTEHEPLSALTKDDTAEKSGVQGKSFATNKAPAVVQTSKSLFDDSDDDDDFLKAFVKKPSPKAANESSLAKTLLFDNEIIEPSINSNLPKPDASKEFNKTSTKSIQNIFDNAEDNEDVLAFNKPTKVEHKMIIQKPEVENISNTPLPVRKLVDKPVVEESAKNSANDFNISNKLNLFDDLDEDEDLFSTKPEKSKNIAQQTNIKETANEDKLHEKNATVTKEIDFGKITRSELKNTTASKNLNIPQTIDLEVAKISDTDSLRTDTNLATKENLFEPSNQEKHTQQQKQPNDNNSSSSLTEDTMVSVAANIAEKENSANKYDFNSVLFLDEPPEDDDAFFETLAKTPSTLNSNYNTIDLENDIYEPELPKVPVSSSGNTQTDATENTFYTGLQLFSDTPPDDNDDDDDDENVVGASNNIAIADVTPTKRLHSVFYDDFNETLMALNQRQIEKENEMSKHSIFSDEPPPAMNEEPNLSSQDITDHKVPDDKQDTIQASDTKQSPEDDNKNNTEFSNKRPVSKLKMPNININIQALLPGANNTLRKAKEEIVQTDVTKPYNDDLKSNINTLKRPIGETEVTHSKSSRTAETEHILPNVTKNRVKGPATRRPSTRSARQENYRKSLIEQQESLESEEEKSESKNEIVKAIKPPAKLITPQKTTKPEEPNGTSERSNSTNVTTKLATSKLFENRHEESSTNKTLKDTNVKNNDNSSNDLKVTALPKPSSLLFDDDGEENDEDFFKHMKTPHTSVLDSNKAAQAKERLRNISAITSPEICETNASISSVLFTDNKNTEVTREICGVFSREIITKERENNLATHTTATSEAQSHNQVTANKLKSFLDGADDEDADDLFTPTLQRSTIANSNIDKNNKAKAQFKSFLDSETDQEESAAAALQTKTSTSVQTAPSAGTPKVSISIPTPKKSNTNLFTDSETDSDDLFGKLPSTKTSTESATKFQTKTKPQSSLFGDESDSDDFLKSSAAVSKTTTSKSALKKNVPKTTALQTNTSLFSDLDSDEDDLFGSGPAKVTTATAKNIQHAKAAAAVTTKITPPVEVSKSKNVADNPLADLL